MKNFLTVCLITLSALGVVSCGDDTENKGLTGKAILSLENSDVAAEVLELVSPEVRSVKISVITEVKSDKALTVSCKVDKDMVDVYNEANGTAYTIAPADTYEFVTDKAILPRYNTRSSSISVDLISSSIVDDGTYILPIRMTTVEGDSSASINEEGSVYYIIFKAKLQEWLDRSDWDVAFVSSEYGEKGGVYTDLDKMSGYALDLLDCDYATYWGYNFKLGEASYVPIYIVFDMKKEVQVDGVRTVGRIKKGTVQNVPYTFKVSTAQTITGDGMSNESDWTYTEQFTEQPNQLANSVFLRQPQKARYLRFTLVDSYTASGNPGYKGGTFAELEVAGSVVE